MARSVLTRPPFGCKDEVELWRHLDCKDGQEHGMRTMCTRVVMLAAVLSGAVPIAARTEPDDMQRLFLFGKLGGLNDKDAAIAAGYSVSVAENTKQRIWKPQVRAEFERLLHMRVSIVTQDGPQITQNHSQPSKQK